MWYPHHLIIPPTPNAFLRLPLKPFCPSSLLLQHTRFKLFILHHHHHLSFSLTYFMAKEAGEEAIQTLRYQTHALKVSIHCEGCKKKVKKVLQSIEGVYHTEVDSQQHKVTVTGNVDAEILIKKLLRSGKLAERWPENKGKKPRKSNNAKDPKIIEESGDSADPDQNKNNDSPNISNGSKKDNDPGAGAESDKEDSEGEEAVGAGGEGSGGGVKKKKKKKKKKSGQGQSGNSPSGVGENIGGDLQPPPPKGSSDPAPLMDPIPSTPFQHAYPYQQTYYTGPPPAGPQAYGLSYSNVYPTSSASHYAPSMHTHTYYRYPPPPPPSDPINNSVGEDDNEGGCSVM